MAAGLGTAARRQLPVRWRLSRLTRQLLTLALAGLVLAVITRRPEFAGVAAPAVLLLAAWPRHRPASVTVAVRLSSARLTEGEQAAVIADVTGLGDYRAEPAIEAAPAITPGQVTIQPERTTGGSSFRLPFECDRWGVRKVGAVTVVLRDRLRLAEGRVTLELPTIDCLPRPALLDRRIVLSRLPSRLGEHAARAAGEGLEFAGVREFVPGDRQRRINWPATTRRGSLQLNTFAAERAQSVVVIADATADVGEPGRTSLDLAFRAAAGTVRSYLAARDRVGLIIYAGRLSWIGPGTGRRQFDRLMSLLLSGETGWERASGLTRLPRAALPPGALIVVFSPLLDARLVEALRDLRERGFSVLVVDVLNAEPGWSRTRTDELARRIWRMEQQAIRFSLRQLAIPVVHWDGTASLDEPLAPYTRRVMLAGRS
jgi:uncharacterized protein (DUF58 family)